MFLTNEIECALSFLWKNFRCNVFYHHEKESIVVLKKRDFKNRSAIYVEIISYVSYECNKKLNVCTIFITLFYNQPQMAAKHIDGVH